MINKIYNGLFSKNNPKEINKMENNLNEMDNHLLNILFDSCINLYNPYTNNYPEIELKFYLEYTNTFDNILNYAKYKEILFDKMLEKKNNLEKKNKYIEYYCIYMSTNEKIKICKTDFLLKFIDKNQNVLYCIEYINQNLTTIDKLVEKYSKLYTCKIEIC
jgi:hypothetical protein